MQHHQCCTHAVGGWVLVCWLVGLAEGVRLSDTSSCAQSTHLPTPTAYIFWVDEGKLWLKRILQVETTAIPLQATHFFRARNFHALGPTDKQSRWKFHHVCSNVQKRVYVCSSCSSLSPRLSMTNRQPWRGWLALHT